MKTPLAILMETGVPALVVGGCAVQLYGYGRFTKETVAAMKLHALRQDSSRLHDIVDIIEMLRCDRGNWSLEEVKAICERYGPPAIFDTLKPHLE